MTRSADPERELARRVAPLFLPAIVAALVVGVLVGGWGVGLSAAIGIAVVGLNFAVSAFSQAWAARVSITALAVVVMVGFVVRMAAILALMFVLERLTSWFVPVAFGFAVIPSLMLLLAYELRLVASGLGRDLIIPPTDEVASP